jgi:hypothetical protein
MWSERAQIKLQNVWGVLPRCGIVRCKLKRSGWLLCPDGDLRVIFSGLQEPVRFMCEYREVLEQSFAGGLRPGGPGRLTGVLYYFTRGPNHTDLQ